jgi:hypothetical protein
MQTIPGIHVATGCFQHALLVDARTPFPQRHKAGTRLGEWLSAGVDSRYAPTHTLARHEAGVTVLFEGYLAGAGMHADKPAQAVLGHYLESGLDCLLELRGSYTGLILDSRTQQAHLFNDRRASRPLFYRKGTDRALLIGPEVFHLASAEPVLREINPVAVCEFLLFASYYNDCTLFQDIKKLPPGSVMSLGPDGHALRRYWEIRIDADKPSVDAEAHTEQLLALFNHSTHELLTGRTRPFLFLSGGIDSRAILGSLRETGFHIPAVTYGTQEGDDAPIARKLAEHCGFPFFFYPISTVGPEHHFADAALRSDCRAEMIDTPTHGPLLDHLSPKFDSFIHGDKSFYGGHSTTSAEAFEKSGAVSLAQAHRLSDMLEPTVCRDAGNSIEQTLNAMRVSGQSLDPQDLKDKIYYEQRLVNRQNAFTAANLRQFEQVRPWLDEDLVDFLFSTPGLLRRDKVCNKRMVEKAFPDLMEIPFAQKDSIPQSNFYRKSIPANAQLAEFVRVQFREVLDARLSGMFRPGSLTALIDSITSGGPFPMPDFKWWHRLPGSWRIVSNRYHSDRLHPINIMLRLMQINLYLQALDAPDTHR